MGAERNAATLLGAWNMVIAMNTHTKETAGMKGRIRVVTRRAGTDEILRETPWTPNMIMLGTNTGKDLILDRLNSENTYSLNITHADLGTGTTPAAASDTALQTAVARAVKATGVVTGSVLSMQFFYADANLANGTYYEFGTFVDGSSGTGTGKIFNRALFGSPYTKATGEDTTVELDITIT